MRLFFAAFTLGVALLVPAAAFAAPITYDLTLTNTVGDLLGGVGTFAIDKAPSPSSVSAYSGSNGSLSAFNISIDGETFTPANGLGTTTVQFTAGVLSDIEYAGFTFDLSSLLIISGKSYEYLSQVDGNGSVGSLTAAIAPPNSPVPEPSTFVLLCTGSVGLARLLRRRLSV